MKFHDTKNTIWWHLNESFQQLACHTNEFYRVCYPVPGLGLHFWCVMFLATSRWSYAYQHLWILEDWLGRNSLRNFKNEPLLVKSCLSINIAKSYGNQRGATFFFGGGGGGKKKKWKIKKNRTRGVKMYLPLIMYTAMQWESRNTSHLKLPVEKGKTEDVRQLLVYNIDMVPTL